METTREYWLHLLFKISNPVLKNLSIGKLKINMPVESKLNSRDNCTHLEALGRTLNGIASWLEHGESDGEEGHYRKKYVDMAQSALDFATDPHSPDFMSFSQEDQNIVDTAFLAEAILRAPNVLWNDLDQRVKNNIIDAFKTTRIGRKPFYSNWLLFSAIIEAALCFMDCEDWDRMRVDYALRQHENWYLGDGVYGDGPNFHADYYNSFVIQPMLMDIINVVGDTYPEWQGMRINIQSRLQRYAHVLERQIAPDGTFPIAGRSITYRTGIFHALAQASLLKILPDDLPAEQIRCALTAVIKRTFLNSDNFDQNGWLTIGLCGHQPSLGEKYISTGSLYLASTIFLPLGLKKDDPFWKNEDMAWSSIKIWNGMDFNADHAL